MFATTRSVYPQLWCKWSVVNRRAHINTKDEYFKTSQESVGREEEIDSDCRLEMYVYLICESYAFTRRLFTISTIHQA